MSVPITDVTITLNTEQVSLRAVELASRRLANATDQVELDMLVRVLTGTQTEFNVEAVWLAVLNKHWHAPISFDDPNRDPQQEPYATYRREAIAVFKRLQALESGQEIKEDEYSLYPGNEEEEASTTRYLDQLLAWASEIIQFIFDDSGYRSAEDLLNRIGHSAFHGVRQYFVREWLEDPYALGYAIMEYPTIGTSTFGDGPEQVALIRSLSGVIIDAIKIFEDEEQPDEVRTAYGHRIALFWPVLKGIILYSVEDMNSPARFVSEDDDLVDLVEAALTKGLALAGEAALGLRIRGSWSKDGSRVENTVTAELVERFRARVLKEQKDNRSLHL